MDGVEEVAFDGHHILPLRNAWVVGRVAQDPSRHGAVFRLALIEDSTEAERHLHDRPSVVVGPPFRGGLDGLVDLQEFKEGVGLHVNSFAKTVPTVDVVLKSMA